MTVLVFATSHKGGTGRSVTSANLLYRCALAGYDSCYVDFDFGSPTAGLVFELPGVSDGTDLGGMHSFLSGRLPQPHRLDVWRESERAGFSPPPGSGHLVLYPGDEGGGEFAVNRETMIRCAEFFVRLDEEYDIVLVDLSAGRSYALELALAVTARPALEPIPQRWLVFHRWTRQHVRAAGNLVHGPRGLLESGREIGHDPRELESRLRFVRTAVVDPASPRLVALEPAQLAWLSECDRELRELASRLGLGRSRVLGSIPLDPVLQWREQIITDRDADTNRVALRETIDAFEQIRRLLVDQELWFDG